MKPMQRAGKGRLFDHLKPEGVVEIEVRHRGKLIETIREKNIILYQGNAEIIRTLATVTPVTAPRLINRMSIGDQGTIPADSTVPKTPTKDLVGLYHEIYRKDIDDRVITINPGSTFTMSANLTQNQVVANVLNTAGLAIGMSVQGTGISTGTVISGIPSSTQFVLSSPATVTGSETLTIQGAANECRFIATFNASDVATTAFSNPSQPRVNEVGLVIINPVVAAGIVRGPVTAPNLPPADEVLMSIRCFKSVPFEIANDVSITIRYTIFLT